MRKRTGQTRNLVNLTQFFDPTSQPLDSLSFLSADTLSSFPYLVSFDPLVQGRYRTINLLAIDSMIAQREGYSADALVPQPNCSFPNFRELVVYCLRLHGAIPSSVGASSKSGAVHDRLNCYLKSEIYYSVISRTVIGRI